MVSLADIARRAGVSVSTVSLALRGCGAVARATAERVRALASEMDYRPNPLLASLAEKHFRPSSTTAGIPVAIFSFPHYPDDTGGRPIPYARDLVEEVRQLGYAPAVYTLTNASDPQPVARELYHRMCQGIILTGSMKADTFGSRFDWSPFSVVQCGRFQKIHPFHIVRPNIFQALSLTFARLRARGYRRIGFAIGRHPTPLEDDDERYGAAAALENGYLAPEDQVPLYTGAITNVPAFLHWFDTHRPEVVVGFTTGYYWHLKSAGFRIPKDVGFVGLHLVTPGDNRFAGLHQHTEEIARQSARLIDQLIRHREHGPTAHPVDILVPSSWNEGATLNVVPTRRRRARARRTKRAAKP